MHGVVVTEFAGGKVLFADWSEPIVMSFPFGDAICLQTRDTRVLPRVFAGVYGVVLGALCRAGMYFPLIILCIGELGDYFGGFMSMRGCVLACLLRHCCWRRWWAS